jgi:hypothetical protein
MEYKQGTITSTKSKVQNIEYNELEWARWNYCKISLEIGIVLMRISGSD